MFYVVLGTSEIADMMGVSYEYAELLERLFEDLEDVEFDKIALQCQYGFSTLGDLLYELDLDIDDDATEDEAFDALESKLDDNSIYETSGPRKEWDRDTLIVYSQF